MNAIAGICRLDGRGASREDVRRMLGAMPHRCPDGMAAWAAGSVALGQGIARLTPEALHADPDPAPSQGGVALVAHARLDNRADLQPALGRSLAEPDEAWLRAAWRTWGRDGLERLVGDFAVAVWDPEDEELVLARDPIGSHPLYYVYRPGHLLAFATEPKALFALGEVPRRLNETRIGDYLAFLRSDGEATIYEGVRRLPAGHTLRLGRDGLRVERFYTLQPASGVEDWTDEAYVARFRELFVEAVRARLRSAVPVGAQLSGGLDSSSVACVARDLLRDEGRLPLPVFALAFPETRTPDERAYVEAVLAQGGFTPHFVDGDATSPLGNLEDVYRGLDDHLVGGTQHLVWALLVAARDAGVRVLLDGIDGDTVVDHGLLRLTELARAGDWTTFCREVLALEARYRAADHRQDFEHMLASRNAMLNRFGVPELTTLAEEGRLLAFARAVQTLHRHLGARRTVLWRRIGKKLLLPLALRRRRPARRVSEDPPPELPPFVRPDFAARVGLIDRLRAEETLRFDAVRDLQRQLVGSNALVAALETTNHCAALLGMDVRHPFMDRRLIEFALALPSHLSLRDGWTRYLLRAAMAPFLPERVAWRVGKADMTPSVQTALWNRDRDRMRWALAPGGVLQPYLDEAEVARRLDRLEELPWQDQVDLTRAATLAIWLGSIDEEREPPRRAGWSTGSPVSGGLPKPTRPISRSG